MWSLSTSSIIIKSRLTASSSKPVPEPSVSVEVRALPGTRIFGRAAANAPGTEEEATALIDAVEEVDDSDAANAVEVAHDEARALRNPVEALNTDVDAAEEETCGEAREQAESVKAADTEAAVDSCSDKGCRTLRNSRRSHRCAPLANS